jgi:hypothetical protein
VVAAGRGSVDSTGLEVPVIKPRAREHDVWLEKHHLLPRWPHQSPFSVPGYRHFPWWPSYHSAMEIGSMV